METAFSVEISNVIPEGSDWEEARPFKFLCGTIVNDTITTYLDIEVFCDTLYELSGHGNLYSWNGVGFDFVVLHDGGIELKKGIVLNHYDMMFDFFCRHGYPVKFTNVLRGFGRYEDAEWLDKTKKDKDFVDYEKIAVEYGQRKTMLILDTLRRCQDGAGILWVSNEGKRKMETIDRFRTVEECLELPEPDVSWMREGGLTRNRFVGWLGL